MEGPARYRGSNGLRRILAAVLALAPGVGCMPYIGTTAASFLRRVEESPDPNIRHLAYAKLASPNCYDNEDQKGQAAKVLSKALVSGREPTGSRVIICRTLGELRRHEGRPGLVKAVDDRESFVRAEACRSLGKVGLPEDAAVLSRIMTADQMKDCQIAAIEGLGELKANDPRIEVMLVDGMESDDPAIRIASLRALRSVTGQDFGVEPAPWRKYVEARLAQADAKTSEKPKSAAPADSAVRRADKAR